MEKFKPKSTLKSVEDVVKGNWEDIGKFIVDKSNIVRQLVCLYRNSAQDTKYASRCQICSEKNPKH